MSIFDPKQTGSGDEPDRKRERDDAPLPTRFGHDTRQRFRPRPKSDRSERPASRPPAPDDRRPFEDDGGL